MRPRDFLVCAESESLRLFRQPLSRSRQGGGGVPVGVAGALGIDYYRQSSSIGLLTLRFAGEWASVVDVGGHPKRGPESDLVLHQRKRRIDDPTTESIAVKHLTMRTTDRIPLQNWNSSGWIQTTDLTIMVVLRPLRAWPKRAQEVEKSLQGARFAGAGGCLVDPPVFTLVDPWWTPGRRLAWMRLPEARLRRHFA